jgi:hypothetical protein
LSRPLTHTHVFPTQTWYNLTGYIRMTVTNKTYTPPSGDKHDYVSNGPYWYPREKAPCLNDPKGQKEREEYVAVCNSRNPYYLTTMVARADQNIG